MSPNSARDAAVRAVAEAPGVHDGAVATLGPSTSTHAHAARTHGPGAADHDPAVADFARSNGTLSHASRALACSSCLNAPHDPYRVHVSNLSAKRRLHTDQTPAEYAE